MRDGGISAGKNTADSIKNIFMSYVLVSYVKLIYFQWIMFREL